MASALGEGSQFAVTLDFDVATLGVPSPSQTTPPESEDWALKGVRILAVDDSEINLEIAKRILELQGARVWLAGSGQAALERLKAEPDGFDVVIMDVQMPLLDGLSTTRLIRGELGLADLPIIALSAGALISERSKAIAAGMNDFIAKPFDPRGLVRSIQHQARRSKLFTENPSPSPTTTVLNALSVWPEMSGVDYAAARAMLGDDAGLFRTFLRRLIHDFDDLKLHSGGYEKGELTEQGHRMHKLRGSAGLLGLSVVHLLATTIENACEAGDPAAVGDLMQQLTSEFTRLSSGADCAPITSAA